MNDSLILNAPHKNFEGIKMVDELGVEYWEAQVDAAFGIFQVEQF